MRRLAAVSLLLALSSAAAAHEVTLRIVAHEPRGDADAISIELQRVAALDGKRVDDGERVTRPVKPGEEIKLDLASGHWSLDVHGGKWWHLRQYVTVGNGPASADVSLWRAAEVTAAVSVKNGKAPGAVNVRFAAPPSEEEVPEAAELECPVVEGKIVRCMLPAGRFDVRVRARGFLGRTFSGKTLSASAPNDLGKIVLQPGAAISGTVEVPGTPKIDPQRVRLYALPAGTPVWSAKPRELARLTANVDARGAFRFDGIAPGEYELTAEIGATHASRSLHVTVRDGTEAELVRPLVLLERKPLAVSIAPFTAPGGERWLVRLNIAHGHDEEQLTQSLASVDGSWLSPPLRPGRYELSIARGLGPVLHSETVEIDSDPLPLFVDLVARGVRGKITLGDRPLADAKLSFIGKTRSSEARSDSEGAFVVELPEKQKEWDVEIRSDVPQISRRLEKVVVKDDEVTIALPSVTLLGEVVTEDGKAVAYALLNLDLEGSPFFLQGTAEQDGHFAIAGLEPGRYSVWATGGEVRSLPIEVEVTEAADAPPLRLVAKPVALLIGDVQSTKGPVAGARVEAHPVDRPFTYSSSPVTGSDGEFEIVLTPGTQEANVFVAPPGFACKIFSIGLKKQNLRIPVTQEGGTLVLAGDVARPQTLWLAHNGAEFGIWIFEHYWRVEKSEANGVVTRTIPMIEAGPYTLCALEGDSMIAAFRRANVMPPSRCASGYLAPFGTLTLALPAPPRAAALH